MENACKFQLQMSQKSSIRENLFSGAYIKYFFFAFKSARTNARIFLRRDQSSRMDGTDLPRVYNSSVKKTIFPVQLHKILSNPKFQTIITWLGNGHAWKILEPSKFEKEVIPVYFRQSRMASFMRQVNGWGFRRIDLGIEGSAYQHEVSSFLR